MSEDVDKTRREDGVQQTQRENPGDRTVRTHREEAAPGGYVRINLPPDLADRYSIVRELNAGGESDVLLVRYASEPDGTIVALKLYRSGIELDTEALDRIRALPPAHVVKVHEYGRSTAGW